MPNMNDVDGQICHFCPYVLFIDKCGCPLKKRNPLLLSSSSSMSASNVFEYIRISLSSNIFVFVFGFYFWVKYIRIRFLFLSQMYSYFFLNFFKQIYSYSYSVVKILFAHLCLSPTRFNSLHIAQCTSLRSGLVGGGRFGPPDTNYRYHI